MTRRTLLALPILAGTAWGVSRIVRPWRPFDFLYGMEIVGPPMDYSWSGDPQRCFVFTAKLDYDAFCALADRELAAAGWRKSPFELPPQITTFVQKDWGAIGLGNYMDIHQDTRATGGRFGRPSMPPAKGWVTVVYMGPGPRPNIWMRLWHRLREKVNL